MADLSVTYMGLPLKNPIVVGSSSLTKSLDGVRRCEDAGAGAIVLKSLFEEQIEGEIRQAEREASPYEHPEAFDYVRQTALHLSEDKYLRLIEDAKAAVSIPVIASLNCVSPEWWTTYASKIAKAGADAIEVNIAIMPSDLKHSAKEIEAIYARIIEGIRRRVQLPIAVKIGPYFTALPQTARSLSSAGATALVLFNRFYQLDIDIEKMHLTHGYHFSSPHEIHVPLRWIAILSALVGCELAASTGIHDGAGVIKQLLAGARVVQVCSVLYQEGLGRVGGMLSEISDWMDRHGFTVMDEFRGRMSMELSDQPEFYERLQYIRIFSGVD
ncbi:MAG: dihydroorotate dehydrogenase-like protein [bacterium]|nr:MAG: dihydroorotate dehydrogenase-like protein [bacterium]